MSVELEPSELGFRRPFNHEVTQILRLRNPHDEPVAFKVKTTAPRQYCVRPNSGVIDANKDVEVQVLLQAMKEDPPMDARCRDKFLVQSAPIPNKASLGDVALVWSDIDAEGRKNVKERKIRVSFLPAYDAASTSTPQREGAAAAEAIPIAAATHRSPSPTFGSPATGATPAKTESTVQQSTYDAAKSKVADVSASANDMLQEQLATAQATIQQLKDAAAEQGLRQRKTDAVAQDSRERLTTGTTGQGVQTQPADGVPVQLVAALCLLSFLLAYFLF